MTETILQLQWTPRYPEYVARSRWDWRIHRHGHAEVMQGQPT